MIYIWYIYIYNIYISYIWYIWYIWYLWYLWAYRHAYINSSYSVHLCNRPLSEDPGAVQHLRGARPWGQIGRGLLGRSWRSIHGKSPFLIGKPSINRPSIPWLFWHKQRVNWSYKNPPTSPFRTEPPLNVYYNFEYPLVMTNIAMV